MFLKFFARQRQPRSRAAIFYVLYAANLLYGFHLVFTIHINSSFLEQFIPQQFVGLAFSAASFLALLVFFFASDILRRIGNNRFAVFVATLQVYALLGLSLTSGVAAALFFFMFVYTNSQLLMYALDIFFESYSTDEKNTGSTRAMLLTSGTIASILSPLAIGFILGDSNNYSSIYLLSSMFMIPFTFLLGNATRDFHDTTYHSFILRDTLPALWRNMNLRTVIIANFLLQLFFAWMIVYTPLYLVQTLGLSWTEFGVIMSIALIAYLVTQYPTGWLADNVLGEKEMLVSGFGIMVVILFLIPFIESTEVLTWAIVLFISRAGASLVEVTTESYFFKKVNGSDANVISLFRMNRPLAYIVAPLLASCFLFFVEIQFLFLILGIILLLGILVTVSLQDTR